MPTTRDNELLTYLFGASDEPVVAQCAAWLEASARFRAFLTANRDKARKKIRGAGDSESMRDLQLELDTAYHLLLDRRYTLEYERYMAGKTRGPDFTVIVKDKGAFNIEVKRLRSAGEFRHWADAICDKLDQMPPSIPNILLVGTEQPARKSIDAAQAMTRLRRLAEAGDTSVFTSRGLPDARAFLRESMRLSGVLHHSQWGDASGGQASLWLNAQAKHPLPVSEHKALLLGLG
ncbi:MAG TPA: hypothetical protein VE338_17165 [Ktedonobacterales bacterium]|jgi:hypothetical protein|nr:hypothetical protein [Ktedonobacterales bacterium]